MMSVIIEKAPLESGVQTLAYMLIHEILENFPYDIVVVDNLSKQSRFASYSGMSDLAVVTPDFSYHGDKGRIELCVEVKLPAVKFSNCEMQIMGQLLTFGKAVFTNGIMWEYYDIDSYIKKNSLDSIDETIGNHKYELLRKLVLSVTQNEREIVSLSRSISCYKRYKNTAAINEAEKLIVEIKKEIEDTERRIKDMLTELQWLNDILFYPEWSVELYDCNDEFQAEKYSDLIVNLYSVFSVL